jgi:hypothetical protein
MRSFKTLLLLMCLAVTATAWGESINESQARVVAARFMASKAMPSKSLKMAHKAPRLSATTGADQAAYYVFNSSDRGYVIVAGDDRAPAVLGYSDQGKFDPQEAPEALQYLLEGYAAQIEALTKGAKATSQLRTAGAITPLVKAVWNQTAPYNTLLPFITSNKHAYTGCTPVALSQVMYYWKWPARPTMPIPAYTSSYTSGSTNLNFDMPELPVIDFGWDAIQNTYQTTDTSSVAALAAATLNLYCAQALQATFKSASTSASTSKIPFYAATFFDYDASAHVESREAYSTQDWADLLYGELLAGRPVIYSGSKASSGHAFICDGYDGNGMFHINWGWNGNSNGYFLLNVLNPDEQGTGSAEGPYGYIYDQSAIIGFQPNKGGSHVFELTATDVVLNSYTGTRESTDDGFTAVVSGKFINYTTDTLAVRFGWGLFDEGGEMIKRLYSAYNLTLKPGFLHTHTERELTFGAGITSGTYRIMPMYSEYGQDNWRPCVGADRNYIEVTIEDNDCYFNGYGTAGARDYAINDITMDGNMHNGRPVNVIINMTNNGTSSNELLYMFADGTFFGTAFVGLEPGETGDITYMYMSDIAGDHTLTWSWNEDGSDPIATRILTLEQMPAANLSATIKILNVTDSDNKIITSDSFSVVLTITNNGSTTYDEDISAKLFKNTQGTSGSSVQGLNQHLTLAPGETTTMQFDMTNVVDGWRYFIKTYFYTEGAQTSLKGTSTYTIVFPEVPEVLTGDVNGDGFVTIRDVTDLIDYLLGSPIEVNFDAADVVKDGNITIADVTTLIDMLLGTI